MKKDTGRARRLVAVLFLLGIMFVGTNRVAEAAPYSTTVSVSITFGTNAQGQTTVTISITTPFANRTFTIIIHSVAATLGTITTNAQGDGSGSFVIPAGFTGSHEVEVVDTVTGQSTSNSIALPVVAGGGGVVGGGTGGGSGTGGLGDGTSGGLPNTGAAVIGLGALAVALLAAGTGLLFTGRRRNQGRRLT